MIISLAPMEGLTGHVFRRVHARHFGKLDRYYTPFLAPPRVGSHFGKRHAAELDPSNNDGLNVVPQLLTNNVDEFVWAADLVSQMGYAQINLNVGCPSKTVVGKGKGSGMLRDIAALKSFLVEVCGRSPIPVSVKTRLGIASDNEFDAVLEAYCDCPLAELIVHPRVQKDFYRGEPRLAPYRNVLEKAPFPIAFNGDIYSVEDCRNLLAVCPQTAHVMIGRGILANPALAREIQGGEGLKPAELRSFHDELAEEYEREMGNNAAFIMKEWWFYAKSCFAKPDTVHRMVREVTSLNEYKTAVEAVFKTMKFAEHPRFK